MDLKYYEISTWLQELKNQEADATLNTEGFTYWEDIKEAVIGGSTVTTKAKAQNPVFKTKINGEHTLSFDLYRLYFDEYTGEYVENPFISLLYNEKKIKLQYDGSWYEFIIKKVIESSDKKYFSYEASDAFIIELAKNGFSLEYSSELYNNTGTTEDLAEIALNDSGWVYDKTLADTLIEKNVCQMYTATTTTSITLTQVITDDDDSANTIASVLPTVTLPSGTTIMIFYPDIQDKNLAIQCIYAASGNYETDEDYVITNGKNYTFTTAWVNSIPSNFTIGTISGKKGNRIPTRNFSQPDAVTKQIVSPYRLNNSDAKYWGYNKTVYTVSSSVHNILSSSTNFYSTDGWAPNTTGISILAAVYGSPTNLRPYLNFSNTSGTGAYFYNSALRSNAYFLRENGLAQGMKFIVRIAFKDNPISTLVPCFGSYTIDNGKYVVTQESTCAYQGMTDYYAIYEITITNPVSYATLKDPSQQHGFFLYCPTDMTFGIEEIFCYEKLTDSNGTIIYPESSPVVSIKEVPVFYLQNTYTTADNIIYRYDSENFELDDSTVSSWKNHEKVRSIAISESNRFNILQEICESFDCWLGLAADHDSTGKLVLQGIYDTASGKLVGYAPHKYVYFKEYIGSDNYAGFKYGVNLQSIQRELQSDAIATKLIVKANTNEFATSGSCNIARAAANAMGTNYLYNFDYYVNKGLLTKNQLDADLYGDGIGLYPTLSAAYSSYRANSEKLIQYETELTVIDSNIQAYTAFIDNSITEISNLNASLSANFGKTANDYFNNNPVAVDLYTNNTIFKERVDKVKALSFSRSEYRYKLGLEESKKTAYEQTVATMKAACASSLAAASTAETLFFKKYCSFIVEGTWNSDDYTDDNLYYYDAATVLATSSKPAVSYTFSIIDLSGLEEYGHLTFHCGDKTFVEDTEFFGWKSDSITPYQEEVIISEMEQHLDSPNSNKITITNFKTQFEDLFQRIAASVQSLKYNEGGYSKAASSITNEGTVREDILSKSLADNAALLSNAKDQTVKWDETGITITQNTNTTKVLKLTAGGIVISKDGGENWTTGISGDGVSITQLTAGTIDAGTINIKSGEDNAFIWNEKGLNAIRTDSSNRSFTHFTRFDQYGLYGINSTTVDCRKFAPTSISDITDVATFSLTERGLYLKLGESAYNHYYDVGGTEHTLETAINHATNSVIGKVSDFIYNAWDSNNIPYYDSTLTGATAFVEVFAVGSSGNEQLVIYDDGTLSANKILLTGSIEWTDASSPSKTIYNQQALQPTTPMGHYSDYPDTSTSGWHKTMSTSDIWGSHTDNGGKSWSIAYLLSGKSITLTTITYGVGTSGTTPPASWQATIPVTSPGDYFWTKTIFTYNDSTTSDPIYTVAKIGETGEQGDKGDKGDQGDAGASGADSVIYTISATPSALTRDLLNASCTQSIDLSVKKVTGATSTSQTSGTLKIYTQDGTTLVATITVAGAITTYSIPSSYYSYNGANNGVTKFIINYLIGTIQMATLTLPWVIGSNMLALAQVDNNTVKINGGTIAAGTVAASSLIANSITADQIAANAITADAISANAIETKGITINDANGNLLFQAVDDGIPTVSIAGWTVTADLLSNNSIGLYAGTGTSSTIRIYAGSTNAETAPFRVQDDGTLYAANGIFGGELSSATGTISGVTGSFTNLTTATGITSSLNSFGIYFNYETSSGGQIGILYDQADPAAPIYGLRVYQDSNHEAVYLSGMDPSGNHAGGGALLFFTAGRSSLSLAGQADYIDLTGAASHVDLEGASSYIQITGANGYVLASGTNSYISAGKIVAGSTLIVGGYGTTLPSSGTTGQVFFLIS